MAASQNLYFEETCMYVYIINLRMLFKTATSKQVLGNKSTTSMYEL